MAADQKTNDRIGTPDPDHEPLPPKIGDAGNLGPVGERKMERDQKTDAIWRDDRPPTADEDPVDPAARKAP